MSRKTSVSTKERGGGGWVSDEDLQCHSWDITRIDLMSDITSIPAPDASFDAILCSEVLDHVPEPTHALDEFARLLKPGGVVITAPFGSIVPMAPYYYCSGFPSIGINIYIAHRGFRIETLTANVCWFTLLRQEITRLGGLERQRGNWAWPFAYVYAILGMMYFSLRAKKQAEDLACFGWQCVAVKEF